MAVGPGANYDANEACRNGRREPIRVDLDVYVLEQGTKLRSYERTFTAAPCGGASPRLVTNLVPNILVGDQRGAGYVP
jgi:hypothetical protein